METAVAVKAFLAQAEARSLSPRTVEFYQWGLSYIATEHVPAKPEDIEEILARAGRRLAQESLHDLWRCLRTFHRWASNRFEIPDPTEKVIPPRHPVLLPRALSRPEVQAVLQSGLSPRDRLLVLVPLDTGLRLSEVADMRKAGLDEAVHVMGKGRKARQVPISPDLAEELRGVGDHRHIWTTAGGGPMSAASVKTVYKRAFARAGVRGGAHALRHTFATEYLRAGGDIYRLSRILGHSSVKVTERYLALVYDDLIDEHRQVSPALRYL